jgi:hypothetical protein
MLVVLYIKQLPTKHAQSFTRILCTNSLILRKLHVSTINVADKTSLFLTKPLGLMKFLLKIILVEIELSYSIIFCYSRLLESMKFGDSTLLLLKKFGNFVVVQRQLCGLLWDLLPQLFYRRQNSSK